MKPASARHITLLAATLIISAAAMTAPASAQSLRPTTSSIRFSPRRSSARSNHPRGRRERDL